MSKRTTTLVGAAVALALQHGAPAYSQSTPGAASDQIEEVIVTGIRGSLNASLEVKRDADSVVEALSAEDLGQFPNTNVAEAMTQVPGVAIDRRFGQGERVSIDGTDPSLNLTFLDGHPVAQSIWLYGEQPNRGFDQTQIASEIIGRIEIFKSPEARLPEGSLGGTVLMHTRKPLELAANTLTGTAAYNYNQQADEGKPSVSGLYSWKNADETFGVAIAAQHYEEQVDRQGMEIFRYVPASTFPNATGVDAGAQVPNSINAAWFQQKRKRDSVVVNLQARPVDALELNLRGLYVSEDFANYNQSVYTFLDNVPGQVDQLSVGGNGIATSGHSGPTGILPYDNNVRSSEPTTRGLDLQGTWRADGWSVSGQVGRSKADNDLKQWAIGSQYTGGFGWNINNGVTIDDSAAARDPANWPVLGASYGVFKTETEDNYAQADLSIALGGMFDDLTLGVRRHKHEEDFSLNVYPVTPTGTLADVGTIGLTDIQDFAADQGRHVYVGRSNVRNWIEAALPSNPAASPANFLNNTFRVEQTNTAAYAQLNFGKGERLRGNFGVRFVSAEITSTAYNLPSGAVPVLPANPQWLVTQKNDDDYVLPALNLAFDASDDVVLRFAAAKVVAWAPYNQMAPNTFLNDTILTGSGGNADLGPYESINYNAAVEWYFAPESVLAASVFYKDIDNFVESNAVIEQQFNSLSTSAPAQFQNLLDSGQCTADGFCGYSIIRPRNAGKGKIKGFNLSYQQPFGATGFGVVANYTFADGETAAGNDLPFQSENQYNVSPYFENDRYSARVTYGWRSEYLGGGFVAGAPPVSVDAYADLGLSLGWTLNEMVQFSLDAQNLLDEEYFQYFQQKSVPANSYKTGRRYQVSVQFKF